MALLSKSRWISKIHLSMIFATYILYCYALHIMHATIILFVGLAFVGLQWLNGPTSCNLINSFSMLYLGFLLALYIQPSTDRIRELMTIFDERLNRPIPFPTSHAIDCHDLYEWNIDSISSKLDRYAISHFAGWMVFTLLTRNRGLVWMMAVFWELMEAFLSRLSDNPYLKELEECWYDSLLFDTFGCNLVGIEVGMLMLKMCNFEPYHWSNLFEMNIATFIGKARAFASLFCGSTNAQSRASRLKYESAKHVQNYAKTIVAVLWTGSIIQFNAFMLKSYLWIPAEHWLNVTRLLMHAIIGAFAWSSFYYKAIKRANNVDMSPFYISALLLVMECAIIMRFIANENFMSSIDMLLAWIYANLILFVVTIFLSVKAR